MTVAETHDASTQGETPAWAWPVYAFVAWLVAVLNFIARFRRIRHGHRFRQDWRDSWEGLRQSEWLRDQLIAQGVAQLLSGNSLRLDDRQIILTPPAAYGGPCPRTPFDMNRRFLALARWAADPEVLVRARFRRLSRILRPAHASTDAALRAAAQHELAGADTSSSHSSQVALMLSSARSARPSKHERVLTHARGPPAFPRLPISHPHRLSAPARLRTRAHASRTTPNHRRPHAPQGTSGGPTHHRSAASWRSGTMLRAGPAS